ncbi:MAG: hypothetical protein Q4D45_05660 [Lachnospiraceae bacterium]|nr:hypothetical protein [Lachnospiraceae bacterium]
MSEQKIPLMEVEFPTDIEIEGQKDMILHEVFPKKKSLWERIKEIYWGPGLKNIFYHCESAWLITAFVYMGVCFACKLAEEEPKLQTVIAMMAFPVCYLAFAFVSCWLEEQEEVIELKSSMHYSFMHMTNLRMFYTSIVTILFDMPLLIWINGYQMQELLKYGAAGVSMIFLFALVSLFIYSKVRNSYYIGFLFLAWVSCCVILLKLENKIYQYLFYQMPLEIHLLVAVSCFVVFMIYVGKVEKENAYAITY